MKTLFIINNIHSFIDVITNSSTELFVYGGDKKLQEVYNILKELWELNKHNLNDNDYLNTSLSDILDLRFPKASELFSKEIKDRYNWGYEDDLKFDTIIIEGTYDNSIPYEFQEIISDTLKADRYHLG